MILKIVGFKVTTHTSKKVVSLWRVDGEGVKKSEKTGVIIYGESLCTLIVNAMLLTIQSNFQSQSD